MWLGGLAPCLCPPGPPWAVATLPAGTLPWHPLSWQPGLGLQRAPRPPSFGPLLPFQSNCSQATWVPGVPNYTPARPFCFPCTSKGRLRAWDFQPTLIPRWLGKLSATCASLQPHADQQQLWSNQLRCGRLLGQRLGSSARLEAAQSPLLCWSKTPLRSKTLSIRTSEVHPCLALLPCACCRGIDLPLACSSHPRALKSKSKPEQGSARICARMALPCSSGCWAHTVPPAVAGRDAGRQSGRWSLAAALHLAPRHRRCNEALRLTTQELCSPLSFSSSRHHLLLAPCAVSKELRLLPNPPSVLGDWGEPGVK